MPEHVGQRAVRSSYTTPIIVFLISLVGPAAVIGLPFMLGWSQDYLSSHLYLFGTLGQALMDLPAIVMLRRGNGKRLSQRRHHIISIGAGLLGAAVLAGVRVALAGRLVFMGGVPAFTQSLTLAWPWNLLSAAAAVLAYGFGEALYVVYFVIAFDATASNPRRLLSRGVMITALLWGLSHSWNVFFFGWSALPGALLMVGIGLIIGLLFKGTRSPLGSTVFWSLVNGTSA
jgi:hypothetical protein